MSISESLTIPEPVKAKLASRPFGVMEVARTARRNILEIIPELATRQPMVSGRLGKRWHMVMDPQGMRKILKDRPEFYPKSSITKNVLRPGIGESLFIAEGKHWLWQRRAASPTFAPRNIRLLGPIMTAAAERAVERVALKCGGSCDLHAEMIATTFEVISDVTFSGKGAIDRAVVHRAIDGYLRQTARVSVLDVLGAPGWIPRFGRLIHQRTTKEMKRVADEAINARKRSPHYNGNDLLDLLSKGQDPETGRFMNSDELRDNLLTFIVAGHETTALSLAWALYLLAFDQDWQEKVRNECVNHLAGKAASSDCMKSLPTVRMVIEEALRLYPPAALLLRVALKADQIGGREVRRGDTMILPIYALHRNICWWSAPDTFDPSRFDGSTSVDRFAYLPFGGGPRICIGAGFAIQESVIVLATLISRFRFELVADTPPVPVMVLTLRPKNGVWLKISAV